MKRILLFFLILTLPLLTIAQTERWQQRAEYTMEIDFNVKKHRYKGKQTLIYYNNSPDVLNKVFYHLYFNAFQPGSMMDIRSQTISDPDRRVASRISKLKPDEIGYQKIKWLKHNGKKVSFKQVGTILEVKLDKAIPPNEKAEFEMKWVAQVPVQIRRSGRDNKEGIDYSMTQWYPKMCEYDYQGWHANPYVGREFYGIWGDFDVKISIDRDYIIGGTGILQNPNEIGYGYEKKGTKINRAKSKKLEWHFIGKNIHDFAWAADPDYTHTSLETKEGTTLHFLYQKNENTEEVWARLPTIMDKALSFMNKKYGKYPYSDYTFIQGGDGGMEYPMTTLITGNRSLGSLVGVSVHEFFHSWYQMVLGTNESLYPWMDEGFTSYASAITMNYLKEKALLPGASPVDNPLINSCRGYANFAQSGNEEALSTHADHYTTNSAYSVASYVKGAVFLYQLQYIIGKKAFDQGLLEYFNQWKFKHPNPNDFIRIMEKTSGLELDWYKEYMVYTTHTIDYAIESVKADGSDTKVTLRRVGKMPMPLDIRVTEANGKQTIYYIPLQMMRGEKIHEGTLDREVLEDWPWTNPEYEFEIPCKFKKVVKIEIDPHHGMAETEIDNNIYEK